MSQEECLPSSSTYAGIVNGTNPRMVMYTGVLGARPREATAQPSPQVRGRTHVVFFKNRNVVNYDGESFDTLPHEEVYKELSKTIRQEYTEGL